MRLLSAAVDNFGSYENLSIKFEDRGLLLVAGKTGSGKSTLQDIACWALFGITAKNGNADDVRSWHSKNDTNVCLTIEANLSTIALTRIRGKTKDLYWQIWDDTTDTYGLPIRGRDIQDSQKLLEKLLGISSELYLTAAVFNEFSRTGNFFTNNAKDRRRLLETISDLSLPTKVLEGASSAQKQTKKDIQARDASTSKFLGKFEQLRNSYSDAERREEIWNTNTKNKLTRLETSAFAFELDKEIALAELKRHADLYNKTLRHRLQILQEKIATCTYIIDTTTDFCEGCKQPNALHNEKLRERDKWKHEFDQLLLIINPHDKDIETLTKSINTYTSQLEELKKEINPFLSQKYTISCDINTIQNELLTEEFHLHTLQKKLGSITQIQELAAQLKGVLVRRAISQIEDMTNDYIQSYFEGEIRVKFIATDSDDLNIVITKNGHECSYSQLSRGQRSLLKLCFSVSVMKISANNAHIHFNTLFFDEVLDGLDTNLKVKAVGLFQELEKNHETIMLTDHSSDLQHEFESRLEVTLEGDCSIVNTI